MKFCPTLHNEIAGIGALFIFQLIFIFASSLTLYSVFVNKKMIIGFLVSLLISYIYYNWMNVSSRITHSLTKWITFSFLTFIQILISAITSIPFCLYLFESQISYQLMLSKGNLDFGFIEQLWIIPFGLYLSFISPSEGNIILSFYLIILFIITFIFIAPYLLIFQKRNSFYKIISKTYEHEFIK